MPLPNLVEASTCVCLCVYGEIVNSGARQTRILTLFCCCVTWVSYLLTSLSLLLHC